jgi:hypothetical protein
MFNNFKLPPVTKNMLLITYKLLYDALLLLLVSFIAMLVAEGALPGLVSSHISFSKIILVIFLVLGGIIFIGSKFHLIYEKPDIKKNKLLPVLILFTFLLIGNSLLKFALWENMIITLATLFFFFLFYQLIFGSKN